MKIKNAFKRIGENFIFGLLSLHLLTQANYNLNNGCNKIFPSKEKLEFLEEFDFPIESFDEDLEGNNIKKLSILSDVIHKENLEKPFKLRSIAIRSEKYIKKSIIQQIGYLITNGNVGHYNFITDEIVIGDVNPRTIHHEIKHKKTFDILKSNPEFLDKWKNLAKDEKGVSLYRSKLEQICLIMKGLDKLIDKTPYEEDKRYGFISSYARTNVYEDIAELCEAVESMSITGGVLNFIGYDPKTDPRIKAKIELAEEYGIIPKEFEEFLALSLKYINISGGIEPFGEDDRGNFLNKTDEFIKKYSKSVYVCDLNLAKADLLKGKFYLGLVESNDKKEIQKVLDAYKNVLKSPYKNPRSYRIALEGLRDLNIGVLDDTVKSYIYSKAHLLHTSRFNQGFVYLSKYGVNDFLRKNGEL